MNTPITDFTRVFVYGTLKKGEGNHHWMDGGRLVGVFAVQGFYLVENRFFPGLVRDSNSPDQVLGEVWEIPRRAGEIIHSIETQSGYAQMRIGTPFGQAVLYHLDGFLPGREYKGWWWERIRPREKGSKLISWSGR